jgi:hypothetical protein
MYEQAETIVNEPLGVSVGVVGIFHCFLPPRILSIGIADQELCPVKSGIFNTSKFKFAFVKFKNCCRMNKYLANSVRCIPIDTSTEDDSSIF